MKNVSIAKKTGVQAALISLMGAALFVAGCSSAPRLAEKERAAKYIVSTPHTYRIDNYNRAKTWLDKNFKGMKTSLDVANVEKRHLSGRGTVPCNELKHWKDPNDYLLTFAVDINAVSYGRTEITFTQLSMMPDLGDHHKNVVNATRNIDNKDELARVTAACLNPLQDSLAYELKHKPTGRTIASKRHH